MRKMKHIKTGQVVEVCEHLILKNFWEYYVLKSPTNTDDIKLCFVMGAENEMGDVSMSEIKPYVISRTKVLNDPFFMPAQGWSWV